MNDLLPEGWETEILSNLADFHNGAAFNSKDWSEDGLPIIRIEQLNNEKSETDKYSGVILPINYIDDDDLIFSWSATLKVAIWKRGPGALNQHLYKVVPKSGINKYLLRHLLDFNMDNLAGQSQGSTMKHVTRKELSRFEVIYPVQENEQVKLASILESIDQTIKKTEALIHKYQQIKAGLMHDLFARGVTADGKLRPPREQAPELYKESSIGWIPREWSIRCLDALTTKIVDGVHHTPEYVDYGIPFVTVKNLTVGSEINFENLNYITEEHHLTCSKRADPKEGDVLVTKDGTLGVCRIVKTGMPKFSIFVSVAMIRVTEKINSEWLHLFFDSGKYLKQLSYLSAGSGLKHIHLEHFRKFEIPLPNVMEQSFINFKLESINNKITIEEKYLSKLQNKNPVSCMTF